MNAVHLTRRELRLTTGLILFAYVSVHFVDHALGLVSVAVAERALRLAVAVGQSRDLTDARAIIAIPEHHG